MPTLKWGKGEKARVLGYAESLEDNRGRAIPGEKTSIQDIVTGASEVSKELVDGPKVEEIIKLSHLKELMRTFQLHVPRTPSAGSEQRGPKKRTYIAEREKPSKPPDGSMRIRDFKLAVNGLLGTDEFEDQLEKVFNKVDISCDGHVNWDEFCTYMLLQYRERDRLASRRTLPFCSEPQIQHMAHNRQEITARVVTIQSPLRFFSVSKEGEIGVWDSHLRLNKIYSMNGRPKTEDESDKYANGDNIKKRVKMWVTDAVYMSDCHKLAIATTCRDIHFYDVSTNAFIRQYHLYGFVYVPYCLDYVSGSDATTSGASSSYLVFGDDAGNINVLTFAHPRTALFQTPFKNQDSVQKIYARELGSHSKIVRYKLLAQKHSLAVTKVEIQPETTYILSCAAEPTRSMIMQDMERRKSPSVFRVTKGVSCFDFNKEMNLLATGSPDHLVRLWNPFCPHKPTALLKGHTAVVLDVKISKSLNQIVSYSKEAVVKVWDIRDQLCVQTVTIKFPAAVDARAPDHGPFPVEMHAGSTPFLIITAGDHIAMLKFGSATSKALAVTTHKAPLCAAIYNPYYKQVVTGAEDSAVAVWDVETGTKCIAFNHAHGDEEITFMTFDTSLRRLLTGSRNGGAKIWNFQNGHNIQTLEASSDAEITGIVTLKEQKTIVTVGWSRMITVYDDSKRDEGIIPCSPAWKGGMLHKEDILSLTYIPPNLIGTASFDGEILIWSVETEKLFKRLRKGRVKELKQSSVDRLLCLAARTAWGSPYNYANLVSSEGGVLKWWNIYGAVPLVGAFSGTDADDESVLAITTNPASKILVAADTRGQVGLWDVGSYCLRTRDGRITRKAPPLKNSWRAHDAAVVSVEFVEHPSRQLVITASTDGTACLWAIDGSQIGTFGQTSSWDLDQPLSWANALFDPLKVTPGSDKLRLSVQYDSPLITTTTATGTTQARTTQLTPGDNNLDEDDDEEDDPRTAWKKESKAVTMTSVKDLDVRKLDPELASRISHKWAGRRKGLLDEVVEKTKGPNSCLGTHVQLQLRQKQKNRKGRRDTYGEVDVRKTSRFGNKCSPYQALEMKSLSLLPQGVTPPKSRVQGAGTLAPTSRSTDAPELFFGESTTDLTVSKDAVVSAMDPKGRSSEASDRTFAKLQWPLECSTPTLTPQPMAFPPIDAIRKA